MALTAAKADSPHRLQCLIGELNGIAGRISGNVVADILRRSQLQFDDVAPFVAPTPTSYGRRRVARTDAFEVLVMTWLPGQCTGAHDHAGALSAFKILRGTAQETRFAQALDSLVDPVYSGELHEEEVGVDSGEVIHSIRNSSPRDDLLVSIHVYAPPLPELRRFAIRPKGQTIADTFRRRRTQSVPTAAIVGGGFSGVMVAAHLARKSAQTRRPLHVVMIDRQTSIAEGAAYRSPNASHLLNIHASGMSAWTDRPDDFLEWLRRRNPAAGAYAFVQRQSYGEYLRATLFKAVAQADAAFSIEIRRDEADSIERRVKGGWRVHCDNSPAIEVDAVVLATGHRPPNDPLLRCWSGSRARYIEDPWASLALTSIGADESVCLLGTGLTAIDVLQSLLRPSRTAPVLALSRRGLVPGAHTPTALPSIDPRAWLDQLLRGSTGITTRGLSRAIRREVLRSESAGQDWRQVLDGLRPHISRIWQTLSLTEKTRFMRHAKASWEVVRHRMAPAVAVCVGEAESTGIFRKAAGRVLSGRGTLDGVTLSVCRRGKSTPETLKFDWIVNCTGPGSGGAMGLPPMLVHLVEAGYLAADPLGLGVCTTPDGRALARGQIVEDLVIVGTLRKSDLWESTAVPELRQQAALAADVIMRRQRHNSESNNAIGHLNPLTETILSE
jgi:uncharacterized NAD(P)/FAD-binding protein YdhS/predicted metal-dependent enzyme (double-stranded beta helix superfamily)